MEDLKIISKQTLVPIGLAVAILTPLMIGAIYVVDMSNTVKHNRELVTQHVAMDDARIAIINAHIQNLQQTQIKSDTKLDYILQNLDEIKKKLNIQ